MFIKSLIIAALLVATAQADPVLLYTTLTCPNRNCTNINNSASIQGMSLYASTGYGFLALNAEGHQFIGKNYVLTSIVDDVLTDPVTGKQVVLTVDYTFVRKLIRSGHNYWVTTWTLQDGMITGLTEALDPYTAQPAVDPAPSVDPPVWDGGCDECHR